MLVTVKRFCIGSTNTTPKRIIICSPNELASQLSVRASDNKLAASVWYYNWVDQSGYERIIRKAARRVLPWWLRRVVPNFLLDIPLASERSKFRQKTCQAIGVVNNNDKELDNEPKIRQILVDELQFFQSHLQTTANQCYLVPGTSQPTAADFSVYVQLERLVGGGSDGTGAYDVALEPALPQLLQEKSLQLLWGWHKRMQDRAPYSFAVKSLLRNYSLKNQRQCGFICMTLRFLYYCKQIKNSIGLGAVQWAARCSKCG